MRGIVKPKLNADKDYGLLLHHIIAIEEGARQGSVLLDISYGAAFEIIEKHPEWPAYEELLVAMEEVYSIIDLGTLAQDHIDRAANEYAWMVRKGYR